MGIAHTPANYFSMFHLDIDGSVQITGSHNPKDYNGIKIVLNWKTLFDKYILELRDIMLEKKYYNPNCSCK